MDQRHYQSQYGQDKIVESICYPLGTEKYSGIFLEIGAYDGVDISNTFYLEKMKNWTGLLVEPIKSLADQCLHNRWCQVWNGCIYSYNTNVQFTHIKGYSEMLSGVKESLHPAVIKRIDSEINQYNQSTEIYTLPGRTLNTIIEQFKLGLVDYCSLDVQSLELDILRSYDPVRNPVKIFSFDTGGINDKEIDAELSRKGYTRYWKSDRSDEYIYINNNIKWSWE